MSHATSAAVRRVLARAESQLLCGVLLLASWLAPPAAAAQQQPGQKVLGGTGINAGVQSPPGLYLVDRFLYYSARTIKDRNGDLVPVPDLEIAAFANVLGLSVTLKRGRAAHFSMAAGVPYAEISISSDLALTRIDRSGLGDAFVQPLKIGWREQHVDVVTSYTLYAPTGKFEPSSGGVGRGYFTHQFSVGGAVFPTEDRRWRASVLGSYDLNGWKRGIEIKRGSTIQVQGGAGIMLFDVMMVGVAGFALWQVSDDRGADLPPSLRGLQTQVYGFGPELGVTIRPLRLQAELRFEPEIGARSRPEGSVLVAGLSYVAWRPPTPAAAPVGR